MGDRGALFNQKDTEATVDFMGSNEGQPSSEVLGQVHNQEDKRCTMAVMKHWSRCGGVDSHRVKVLSSAVLVCVKVWQVS